MTLQGSVQGVGMRPFVARLARTLNLSGSVSNIGRGVAIEVTGPLEVLDEFHARLMRDAPPASWIEDSTWSDEPAEVRAAGFRILTSPPEAPRTFAPRDRGPCADCLAEMADPKDRRFQYPFTSCATCGPRFTIVRALPFDRERTSLQAFPLCPTCEQEYSDPTNRRYHAQTISCPECGPDLTLHLAGEVVREHAWQTAVSALLADQILAVKGVGGYQLVGRATLGVIARIREIKGRPDKPLAIMTARLSDVKDLVALTAAEQELLTSAARPIVLVAKRCDTERGTALAPGLDRIGVMLPPSPLHQLIANACGEPLVVTSANAKGAPIITDDQETLALTGIDGVLSHNLQIEHHADDPIMQVVNDRPMILRPGRGTTPTILPCNHAREPTLGLGGFLKNTFALGCGEHLILSQHMGDLSDERVRFRAEEERARWEALYQISSPALAGDAHPDARAAHPVYHHAAHVWALIAEHSVQGNFLAFAWDGFGWGESDEIWGGETFVWDGKALLHVGTIRPVSLLGGDLASREPRRCALAVWREIRDHVPVSVGTELEHAFSAKEWSLLSQHRSDWHARSMGRLFDAAAFWVTGRQRTTFEGQAAMEVEAIAAAEKTAIPYEYTLTERDGLMVYDWRTTFIDMLNQTHESPALRASRFHATLVALAETQVLRLGRQRVGFCGGVWQNRLLAELAFTQIEAMGRTPLTGEQIPVNDAGLAIGQVYATTWQMRG